MKVSITQSCLFATPWTIARQAPLSLGFSKEGYWSGLPFPPPGDLPDAMGLLHCKWILYWLWQQGSPIALGKEGSPRTDETFSSEGVY